MNFNNTGALNGWSTGETVIIPEIKASAEGRFRGGAFLCIPNFDQLPHPFEIKHGEYRNTACDPTLPHEKLLASNNPIGWGKISTQVIWEEKEVYGLSQLEVKAHIDVLSLTATLRPGFHPYFKVHDSFSVEAGAFTITSESLPLDKPLMIVVHKNASGSAVATLKTGNLTISIAASIENWPLQSSTHFSFAIWSDNPKEYICVEPVYGITHGMDNLPTAFSLSKGQSFTMVSKIIVSKTK